MAKPRKGKSEEQKGENTEAVIRHQKLCLSIDMEKRRIYGFTEIEIAVPDSGIVELHADNLVIESVTVDEEPAQFEVFPHYLHLDSGDRWCSVSSASSAADAAGSVYLSTLDRELVPNLLIMCSKSSKPESEQQEEPLENGVKSSIEEKQEEPGTLENGVKSSAEEKQNVKKLCIDYWVEKAETGIHFDGDVLHTDNQIRRARCWFPCMDDNLQRCCYDLEFTVASNLVAVSSGTLLYQVLSKDDPSRKTYVYRLDVPVTAGWISLVVAPFEILPDRHIAQLSHICLPPNLSKLRNTIGFFHNTFSHYEDYLAAPFPFGSYTQVFLSPEMAISSLSLGASMSIFSSQLLFDEKVIDQTIETRIKLAYALARQWFGVYITSETPNDDWLLDGLAGFLTDTYIKRFLGNNEARYRRYKANCAVCRADDSGATALSSSASSKDLYGTQCIGFYGKVRVWKSVAVLQMLEKQMGPEPFRKILQQIVSKAQITTRTWRTLSTKEFRHLANKVGNLERPFLKEFFPRWVGSCGCPVLKMGFSYNKRKNLIELAVIRGCTARLDASATTCNGNLDSENREGDVGWPGMMSIRLHELDGMYDHPILPMTGEPWQLLEIQCHSRLAAKRFQKPKKGSKPDGSDENEAVTTVDVRSISDSPLLWLRADPEMEYLAEIHFSQPVQMWINQLERDKDVIAQVQAIAILEALPHLSFSIVNALNNILKDSKVFWKVRIEAAFALANTASEETDWAGLLHLITFYKSRRFDSNIGLPKPNDFHDFQEYFVLEAIPHAIATVRATDKKSPREAVEFVLQLLKYNDNSGNFYSDVYWLAALIQSIGELEFGQQSIVYLSSLLKRLDRLLQFDRLMPSHNGILTISCIRSLTQIALKLSEFVPLDRVIELIEPFRTSKAIWQVRVEASRSLLDLEFQCKGIDAALSLFIKYLSEESSLRGQVKLGVHAMRLCQIRNESGYDHELNCDTLVALLRLLESPISFNNVFLRHYLFCILQVLAGRVPTLHGVPRDESMGHAKTCNELKNIFAALVKQSKPSEPPMDKFEVTHNGPFVLEVPGEADFSTLVPEPGKDITLIPDTPKEADGLSHEITIDSAKPPHSTVVEEVQEVDTIPISNDCMHSMADIPQDDIIVADIPHSSVSEVPKELDSVTDGCVPLRDIPQDYLPPPPPPPPPPPEIPILPETHEQRKPVVSLLHEDLHVACSREASVPESHKRGRVVANSLRDGSLNAEASREHETISAGHERKKPVFRIKVKKSTTSSCAGDPENPTVDKSHDGLHDIDRGASSSVSVSVDAPQRNFFEGASGNNHNNIDDVNSCHDVGSRVTASIGSVKVAPDGEELMKELQCTAESSKVPPDDQIIRDRDVDMEGHKFASLQSLSCTKPDVNCTSLDTSNLHAHGSKGKHKKRNRDEKREKEHKSSKHDDPEYLERKRLKKEKKRKEKEMAKLLDDGAKPKSKPKPSPSVELSQKKRENVDGKVRSHKGGDTTNSITDLGRRKDESEFRVGGAVKQSPSSLFTKNSDPGRKEAALQLRMGESSGAKLVSDRAAAADNTPASAPQASAAAPASTSHKLKIKIKNRTLGKS
nr:transcription initiation factor TFIID subunit 2 isoform X1 [Ipomoea trifida]